MNMKIYAAAIIAVSATSFAIAAQRHGHCEPEPKPRDPPAVSKPDPAPRSQQSRDEGQRDPGTLCARWPGLVFCKTQ